MTTKTYRDFDTNEKVTCEDTGKKWFGGKILWVNPETGIFYERTNRHSQTCVKKGTYFFRKVNESTQKRIEETLF